MPTGGLTPTVRQKNPMLKRAQAIPHRRSSSRQTRRLAAMDALRGRRAGRPGRLLLQRAPRGLRDGIFPLAAAAQQGPMGRPAVRAAGLAAGPADPAAVWLAACRRHAPVPEGVCRDPQEKRQIDAGRRHWFVPAGGRRRDGSRGLLGRCGPRPGVDRARRGDPDGGRVRFAERGFETQSLDARHLAPGQQLDLQGAEFRGGRQGGAQRSRPDCGRAARLAGPRTVGRAPLRRPLAPAAAVVCHHHGRRRSDQRLLRAVHLCQGRTGRLDCRRSFFCADLRGAGGGRGRRKDFRPQGLAQQQSVDRQHDRRGGVRPRRGRGGQNAHEPVELLAIQLQRLGHRGTSLAGHGSLDRLPRGVHARGAAGQTLRRRARLGQDPGHRVLLHGVSGRIRGGRVPAAAVVLVAGRDGGEAQGHRALSVLGGHGTDHADRGRRVRLRRDPAAHWGGLAQVPDSRAGLRPVERGESDARPRAAIRDQAARVPADHQPLRPPHGRVRAADQGPLPAEQRHRPAVASRPRAREPTPGSIRQWQKHAITRRSTVAATWLDVARASRGGPRASCFGERGTAYCVGRACETQRRVPARPTK